MIVINDCYVSGKDKIVFVHAVMTHEGMEAITPLALHVGEQSVSRLVCCHPCEEPPVNPLSMEAG